jgi:hypothetical protein
LHGRTVDALDQQIQPAPEDLELPLQVFASDIGAAEAVAIERGKQPLQLDLGAGYQPQADVHLVQFQLMLLPGPVEAE